MPVHHGHLLGAWGWRPGDQLALHPRIAVTGADVSGMQFIRTSETQGTGTPILLQAVPKEKRHRKCWSTHRRLSAALST